MESLTKNMDAVDVEKSPDLKTKTQIDRVTLNKDESEKINHWLNQIKESTKGFLDLTRSDLVNHLIKAHAVELTAKEIKNIRSSHYSLIKHLNWITPQLKKALDENNFELVKSLQTELRGLEIGVIDAAKNKMEMSDGGISSTSKKQRIKKSKIKASEDENEITNP